jgi:protein-disulfide isomerase
LFRDLAKAIGLDLAKYDACVDSQRYAGRIQASVEEGAALGVKGTPSFFVNGRPFGGRATSDDIKALVDSLSKKSHK